MQPTPVKAAALELGLECFQPLKAKDPESLEWIRSKNPDLIVVAAYGQILPQVLLDIPRFGCINVHTSLLPKYRGAAPIQWAILEDCHETGVTLMKMNAGLDTGDILAVRCTPIKNEYDAGTLHDHLAKLGGELLVETLPDYFAGKITPRPQPEEGISYARKITKEDGHLDWNLPVRKLFCRIRAFNPWPGTYCFINYPSGKRELIKIWKAIAIEKKISAKPGTILNVNKNEGIIEIACSNGVLHILTLQREGKKRMDTSNFLTGSIIPQNIILE